MSLPQRVLDSPTTLLVHYSRIGAMKVRHPVLIPFADHRDGVFAGNGQLPVAIDQQHAPQAAQIDIEVCASA